MSTCGNCGNDLPRGYLRCPSCGSSVGSALSANPVKKPQYTPFRATQAPQSQLPPSQLPARYAGFWVRLAAQLIDSIVLWALYGTLLIFFSFAAGETGWIMALSLSSLISLFYEGYFLSRNWFATPGKRALKLQVLDESHQHISFSVAMGRSLLKFVSGITCGIGYLMIAFTNRSQGLHDLMVKTVVIRL